MASESSTTSPRRPEPDLDIAPLARMTRKTVERLAPFCQMRLPPGSPHLPLVPKTNSKILSLIQAVDTSMLVAQIGYRLASDAVVLCDPFSPTTHTVYGNKAAAQSTPEMLQTMAAHGHGHCMKTNEAFSNAQQEIFKIAAVTKDKETAMVLVPPDPQQPATRRLSLKEVGTDLVENLNLLNQFSRSMMDLTSWWEWLEEELVSPNSTLLPVVDQRDAELCARWSKIKGGYLDYYNIIRIVYTRYPQLFTTSSTAWQSLASVPPPPSAPGSSWDGSFQDIGAIIDEAIAETARNESKDALKPPLNAEGKEEEDVERKAKSIKSVKSVKAFVRKIGFTRVFGRKGRGSKGKQNEEKEGGKGKGKAKEETTEKTPVVDISNKVEPEPIPTAVELLPPKEEVQEGQKPDSEHQPQLPKEEAVVERDGGDRDTHNSSPSTSTSTSRAGPQKEGEVKAKGGVAKVLAVLKRSLAKLGCQGGSEIED